MNSTAGSRDSSKAEELHRELLAAHDCGDGARASTLYTAAADLAEEGGEFGRACFFLTQAYVLALEAGLETVDGLEARLRAHGRL